ncbi:MAG: class I SAM-dependent methyltransferase [Deltaproteobacteria bacterium]|nr:class I SAM-dependent methyltransferase [Deltaproteobacteria bacterium]
MNSELLELLSAEHPLFQLHAGAKGLRSSEKLFVEQGGSDTSRFARASAALPLDSLQALLELLRPEQTTLEIGGGHSTVVFAASVARHYCVNPDRTANDLIRRFLSEHQLSDKGLVFVAESSDRALPGLEIEGGVDVALMDGNHSFPFPMLDWHYVDRHLRAGSLLLIDNVEINAVRMLTEYLRGEPAYRLVRRVRGGHRYDCHVYEKVCDQIVAGWSGQAINNSSLGRLFLDASMTRLWQPLLRTKRRLLGGGERRVDSTTR